MYDAGLQGPDFFFYYNPFMSTPTGDLGKTFHRQTGHTFFAHACKAASSEAASAYLYGLLGHYCLDSVCHPFVNRLVEIGEAKHVLLESEFERYLLTLDGEASPHTFNAGRFLQLTRGECMTAAEFFPGTTGATVSRSIRFMTLFIRLLAHPNRPLQEKILKKIGPALMDYRIPEKASDDLAPYVAELYSLFLQAQNRYPDMLQEITAFLQNSEALGPAFSPTFG